MVDRIEGLLFLKGKYDLHNTPEVYAAVRRTEKLTGQRVPQKPVYPIQNYLDRFHKSSPGAIKRVLLPRFTTNIDDFPESYWGFTERIIRERGEQADWDNFTPEQKHAGKRTVAQNLIHDQRASLEAWIDFFASPESEDLPDYFKYWVFRSVTDLKQYDKEKKIYPQRSRGTVDLFPEINADALRYVHSMLSAELKGEADRYDCDLTKEQEEELRRWLKQENFPRLYAFANGLLQPIPERLLQITEGQWIKYPQGSDPFDLFESIRGRGTGWCTIGAKSAQSELALGDFYCYYSLDEDGNPVIPRIAIRMRDQEIFELRGIVGGQNIDPYMDDVLAKKLTEFPDSDKFFKRRADMARLTELDRKAEKGNDLDISDLLFLYEVDEPIESFGIRKDPRIKELRDLRDPQKDLIYVFSGIGGIAYNPAEINPDTKAYVGLLTPEVFKAGQIEYIYTTFPGNRIRKEKVTIGASLSMMQEELRKQGVWMKGRTRNLLGNIVFEQNSKEIDIFWLDPADLGFDGPALIIDLIRRAKEVGLTLPPAQTALSLRLSHLAQPEDQRLLIGNEPITDKDNEEDPYIFALVNNTLEGLLVDTVCVWDEISEADKIAFSILPGQS